MILDGGLGSELNQRGYDISSSLWSAELLISNPLAIAEVHPGGVERAMRTRGEPLIALYQWRGGNLTQKSEVC